MLTSRCLGSNNAEGIHEDRAKLQQPKREQANALQDDIIDVEIPHILEIQRQIIRNLPWRLVADILWCQYCGSQGGEDDEEIEEHEKEVLRDDGQLDIALRDHSLLIRQPWRYASVMIMRER